MKNDQNDPDHIIAHPASQTLKDKLIRSAHDLDEIFLTLAEKGKSASTYSRDSMVAYYTAAFRAQNSFRDCIDSLRKLDIAEDKRNRKNLKIDERTIEEDE